MHEHIDDARSDDGGHQSPEGQIQQGRRVEAYASPLVKDRQHAHDRGRGDHQAVGVDVEAVGTQVKREEGRSHLLSRAGSASQRERRP